MEFCGLPRLTQPGWLAWRRIIYAYTRYGMPQAKRNGMHDTCAA